ncbi:hypothetical protein AVP41_01531 [Microbacterium sp. TNHR37B]|nr:hypothetical protein AVP41_01531 [Microbacterium sp. TNHR37B]
MHKRRVKSISWCVAGLLAITLVSAEGSLAATPPDSSPAPSPASSPEADDAASPAPPAPTPSEAASPTPEPTVDGPASPEPTVSETPGSPTPDPSPSEEPSPSEDPSPTPSVPVDDLGHDGPTLPLTREMPGGPSARLVTTYGPQPVFRFPFAPNQRWGASGSHADSDGIHRGAVDFAPLSSADKKVRAVAAGRVYRVTCGKGWFLGVDHGGGWMSEYYHLTNAQSSLVGDWVQAGTYLGNAGQTLPCGGTPGNSAHVHLSILNLATDVPSGKRHYISLNGIQFDNYTLHDSSGAYNGVWRNLAGSTVLTSRHVTCCLRADDRVGPVNVSSSLPDAGADGIDDYSQATDWNTDIDRDGRPDLVGFGPGGVYTARNTGDGFSAQRRAVATFGTAKGWERSTNPRMVVDVNGDGRADVVGFANSGVYVATSAGSSFSAARQWVAGYGAAKGWKVGRHERVLADVTGDGLPDIVGFGEAGVYVSRNTGTSFTAPALWGRVMGSASSVGGWLSSRNPRFVVDVTGDGRADLVGFANKGVYVSRNTGSGFAKPQLWVSSFGNERGWTVASHPRMVTDIDGDGRPDIVGFGSAGVYVSRNTGSSFATAKRWSASFGYDSSAGSWRGGRDGRTLADVNGDGRPDVVGFSATGTFVALNRGTSFGTSSRWTADFGSREWTAGWMPRSVVDVDGDGRADIVGFARDGVHVSLSDGSRFGAATHWSQGFGWGAPSGSWRVATHPRAVSG